MKTLNANLWFLLAAVLGQVAPAADTTNSARLRAAWGFAGPPGRESQLVTPTLPPEIRTALSNAPAFPEPVVLNEDVLPLAAPPTNAVVGSVTNGCQLALLPEKPVVGLGEPVTLFVSLRNVSQASLTCFTTTREAPWFCEFRAVNEAGEDLVDRTVLPAFWSSKGGSFDPQTQILCEVRLDRIFRFQNPGKFLIYAKKSMSASGLRSEVFAGPATIQVVKGEGTKPR
jgi:hypothetical protein